MPEKLYIPNGTIPEGLPMSDSSSRHEDRSFLIDKLVDPADGRLIYPIDEDIMMPHLLRIITNASKRSQEHLLKFNYDHSWYHRLHPDLRDPGGRVVRHTMGQVIPVWIHELKNIRFGRLEWIPHTNAEKFEAAVNGVTGVASRWAVDVSRPDNNLLVRLGDDEFAYLTDKIRFHRQEALKDSQANRIRNEIGLFFVSYALERGIRGIISDRLIDQFLNTEDAVNRKVLGNFILKAAIVENVSQLNTNHSILKSKGLVKPDAHNPTFAVWKYIKKAKLPDYYSSMIAKLIETAA